MKNLRITSGVEIDGEHYDDGDLVEGVDNSLAAQLVGAGRAIEVPSRAPKIHIPDPEPESRDPEPEQAPEKPARRRKP